MNFNPFINENTTIEQVERIGIEVINYSKEFNPRAIEILEKDGTNKKTVLRGIEKFEPKRKENEFTTIEIMIMEQTDFSN